MNAPIVIGFTPEDAVFVLDVLIYTHVASDRDATSEPADSPIRQFAEERSAMAERIHRDMLRQYVSCLREQREGAA